MNPLLLSQTNRENFVSMLTQKGGADSGAQR